MAEALLKLIPSVKLKSYRTDDEQTEDADEAFSTVHEKVLKRDHFTCRGCQMKTRYTPKAKSGFFEVHHIDDDHKNNEMDNLATICPFCHSVFHIGNAGARGVASVIWLPEISQADLNLLSHVMFILMYRGKASDATDEDKSMMLKVSDFYTMMSTTYADKLEEKLGKGMSNARTLGETLAWLGNKYPKAYERRERLLASARILPNPDGYQAHIAHWARASNYPEKLIAASMLPSLYDQWKRDEEGSNRKYGAAYKSR